MILNFFKNFLRGLAIISLTVYPFNVADACGWDSPRTSPSRYPAFQFINTPLPRDSAKETSQETIDFWYNYVNDKVSREEISDFINGATCDEVKDGACKNSFLRYLAAHGDTAAMNFLEKSMEFSEALNDFYANVWDYDKPSDSMLPAIVNKITIPSENNPMFERYVFLDIRANAAMHRYDRVIELWDRYHNMIKNEELRNRMLGYLGGAYYHTKNYVDAISIFSKNGDVNSLNWCLARLVGTDNMIKLFNEDPNSDAVYYVLQDYMNYLWLLKLNNANEYSFAFPGNPYRNGSYDVNDDITRECRRLISVANMALADARVEYPAVWATAKAFALNLIDDGASAKAAVEEAMKLKGTEAMKNNLDRIDFWIDFSNYKEEDVSASRRLAERYNTLYTKAESQAMLAASIQYDRFSPYPEDIADYVFLANFMVPYATIQYKGTSLYYRALAMMSGVKSINSCQDYSAFDPSCRSTNDLQREGLSMMIEKLDNRNSLSPIDKAIFSGADINPNPYYDALGRIELSKENYEGAIEYFDKLDLYWIGRQGYFVYLQTRYDKKTEPFERTISREESVDSLAFIEAFNYRADYCRYLFNLKQKYDDSRGNEKAVAGYNYAAALFQASAQGDLWAVSDNMWSVCRQVDALSKRAVGVLVEASRFAASDVVKSDILYGIASVQSQDNAPSYDWSGAHRYKWNWESFSQTQLNAYAELAKLYGKTDNPRIKGCDILKAYMTEKHVH